MRSLQYGRCGVNGMPAGNEIRQELGAFGDVRATAAFELTKERGSYMPEPEVVKALIAAVLDDGLTRPLNGFSGNMIQILPALTIDMNHLREGFYILEVALKA